VGVCISNGTMRVFVNTAERLECFSALCGRYGVMFFSRNGTIGALVFAQSILATVMEHTSSGTVHLIAMVIHALFRERMSSETLTEAS
jgi:hypothetical protein